MRPLIVLLALSCSCLAGPASAVAQEGHPMKGSWIGTWAGNTSHGPDVVVVLNWDGKAITGMINPGTDNIPDQERDAQSRGWVVHLEADAKDKAGRALSYVIDGKIENLPLPNRTDHRHVEEPERERRLQDQQTVGDSR